MRITCHFTNGLTKATLSRDYSDPRCAGIPSRPYGMSKHINVRTHLIVLESTKLGFETNDHKESFIQSCEQMLCPLSAKIIMNGVTIYTHGEPNEKQSTV